MPPSVAQSALRVAIHSVQLAYDELAGVALAQMGSCGCAASTARAKSARRQAAAGACPRLSPVDDSAKKVLLVACSCYGAAEAVSAPAASRKQAYPTAAVQPAVSHLQPLSRQPPPPREAPLPSHPSLPCASIVLPDRSATNCEGVSAQSIGGAAISGPVPARLSAEWRWHLQPFAAATGLLFLDLCALLRARRNGLDKFTIGEARRLVGIISQSLQQTVVLVQ
jgi:hypothetical protein